MSPLRPTVLRTPRSRGGASDGRAGRDRASVDVVHPAEGDKVETAVENVEGPVDVDTGVLSLGTCETLRVGDGPVGDDVPETVTATAGDGGAGVVGDVQVPIAGVTVVPRTLPPPGPLRSDAHRVTTGSGLAWTRPADVRPHWVHGVATGSRVLSRVPRPFRTPRRIPARVGHRIYVGRPLRSGGPF